MKIERIQTGGLGPLPALDWSPGQCEVIYDDNQQGKTTLIDVLIQTVFKEGRKQLFKSEDRYETEHESSVTISKDDNHHTFESDARAQSLSELLGWKIPELHRFLCVRAGEINIAGPREPEDIWQSLATVIGGLESDYVSAFKRTLRDKVNITKGYKWSNKKPDKFKDRITDKIVPKIRKGQKAEHNLRQLIQKQNELKNAQHDRQALDEKYTNTKKKIQKLERQITKSYLDKASETLREARTTQRTLNEDFGRIKPEFEEPWEQAMNQGSDLENAIDRNRSQHSEHEETLEELTEKIDTKSSELEELETRIEEASQEHERAESRHEEHLREVETRKTKMRPKKDRAETVLEEYNRWTQYWEWARWAGLAGLILLAGGLVVLGINTGYGLGLVGVGGAVLAGTSIVFLIRKKTGTKKQKLLAEINENFSFERENPTFREAVSELQTFLETPTDELVSDQDDTIDEYTERIQKLREKRSGLEAELNNLNERKTEIEKSMQDLDDEYKKLADEKETHEKKCEEFRNKTSQPDFAEYEEKLEEARTLRSNLKEHLAALRVYLDAGDDAELSDLEVILEEQERELDGVDNPEKPVEKLEDERNKMDEKLDKLESEKGEIENRIESLDRWIRNNMGVVHDLGIELDHPETLFQKQHQWNQELQDAVRDRLAGVFLLELLDQVENDYRNQIKDLLSKGNKGETLTSLYSHVMGENCRVEFNVDSSEFTVHENGTSYHEDQLSTGAMTHLYLSCRLVVLRALFSDDNGFMILDDPFLSYFPERKKRAIEILKKFVDDGWQIILFTVDPTSRDHFQNVLGANVRSIKQLSASIGSAVQ